MFSQPQATPLPERYALMRDRAALFASSANWAYVAIALAALWFGFPILFQALVSVWMDGSFGDVTYADYDAFVMGSSPSGVRWALASFGLYWGILWVILKVLHQRSLWSLIGSTRVAAAQFTRVSLYIVPIYAVSFVPSLFDPTPFQNLSLSRWLLLLPATLPLLFVQIGAEEIVFRGYLQSHIAALSRNPVVWMGVPSFLFGLIHYDASVPPYSAWAYVAWATCLGLVCADLTARSGTLGPAFAVHFVNNFVAILILAADDWLYGAALFVWPTYGQAWEPWIVFEGLFLLTIWLAARLSLRR